MLRRLIPRPLLRRYHWLLALIGAVYYRFPSQEITVIAVTGTKGKTTTAELVNSILERAGYETALAGTLRFKIGSQNERNTYKMTMPGRFFLQRFLRQAVQAGAQYAVIEMTSEGAVQHRHAFIELDVLIFTNIAPEHIESHGSFGAYLRAKLSLAEALARSQKARRIFVANGDDAETPHFVAVGKPKSATAPEPALPTNGSPEDSSDSSLFETHLFSLEDAKPYTADDHGCRFTFRGTVILSALPGEFNLYNLLAAATLAEAVGVPVETIKAGLEACRGVPGRAEDVDAGQPFRAVVDYAHTPDSLEAIYEAFKNVPKVCVLGSTGGGRDKWKREVLGKIADAHCKHIVLTDEDPYDEDPEKIVQDIATGITRTRMEVIMDRRAAISRAVAIANPGDAVIITGKGTDPYIMGPRGTKTPWSDAEVAKEEIKTLRERQRVTAANKKRKPAVTRNLER